MHLKRTFKQKTIAVIYDFDGTNPLRIALSKLQTLDTVRIIEEV